MTHLTISTNTELAQFLNEHFVTEGIPRHSCLVIDVDNQQKTWLTEALISACLNGETYVTNYLANINVATALKIRDIPIPGMVYLIKSGSAFYPVFDYGRSRIGLTTLMDSREPGADVWSALRSVFSHPHTGEIQRDIGKETVAFRLPLQQEEGRSAQVVCDTTDDLYALFGETYPALPGKVLILDIGGAITLSAMVDRHEVLENAMQFGLHPTTIELLKDTKSEAGHILVCVDNGFSVVETNTGPGPKGLLNMWACVPPNIQKIMLTAYFKKEGVVTQEGRRIEHVIRTGIFGSPTHHIAVQSFEDHYELTVK